jgi:general secretion pathway protein L
MLLEWVMSPRRLRGRLLFRRHDMFGRLGDLFFWWVDQMADLVPHRLRGGGEDADRLLINWTPGQPLEIGVVARRGGRDAVVGRFPLTPDGLAAATPALTHRGRPIALRLPAEHLLERDVTLPIAAEREAARVLEYDMDRITPFTAHEVFWAWRRQERDRVRGRVTLRLCLIAKARLAPLLESLVRAGIRPTALEASGWHLDLAPRAAPSARAVWIARAAVGACAALAVAAVALPFVLQQRASARVADRIAFLAPRVTEVETLRHRIAEGGGRDGDVIAAERARRGDALHILAVATNILPDDTYLTDLLLRERKLTISGRSGAAVKLIASLSVDPTMRNVAFAAPVTRNDRDSTDLFSIHAEASR